MSSSKCDGSIAGEGEAAGLVVANDGKPIFVHPNSSTSVIYITSHTPELPVSWWTPANTEGSNHFQILIGLDSTLRNTTRTRSVTKRDCSLLFIATGDAVMAIAECMKKALCSIGIWIAMPYPDLKLRDLMAA